MSWKQQPRDQDGRWSRKAGLQKLANFAKKHKATIKDAVVNSGGLAGSIIGGQLAGYPGALAGDLIGALATRAAVSVTESALSARQKLKRDEAFRTAKKLQKLKTHAGETLMEMKRRHAETHDDVTGDSIGWLIGNVTAQAANNLIPASASIPLKGAAAAMVVVPKLVKARRERLKRRGSG